MPQSFERLQNSQRWPLSSRIRLQKSRYILVFVIIRPFPEFVPRHQSMFAMELKKPHWDRSPFNREIDHFGLFHRGREMLEAHPEICDLSDQPLLMVCILEARRHPAIDAPNVPFPTQFGALPISL